MSQAAPPVPPDWSWSAAGTKAASDWREPVSFVLLVFAVLVLSQGWVTLITGPDPVSIEEPGLVRAMYFPGYTAALLAAGLNLRQTVAAVLRTPLLWCLMALVFLSASWSIAPDVTFRRAIAVGFTTLAGLAIGARYGWARLAEVFATVFAVLILASLLLGLGVPSYGRMSDIFPGSWRGVWFDKNALGNNMSLGFPSIAAAAILNPRRRRLWMTVGFFALALLALSTSKTSLVSCMIGCGAICFVWAVKRGPLPAIACSFLAVLIVGAAVALVLFDATAVFEALGKDATLTGRTEIWSAAWRQVLLRPWTGYGYGAVWTDESGWGPVAWITKEAGWRARHAHSGWFETLLGLGFSGLFIFAGIMLATWGRALLAGFSSPGGYFALPFLAVYTITSLTESIAFVYNDFIWTMFVAVAVRLAQPGLGKDRYRAAEP